MSLNWSDVRADLHTHSDRTDGASSVDQLADAAMAAGLQTWGLSDHVRASTPWVAEYVRATRALRRDGVEIRCGVEAKILDTSGRLDLPADARGLDYVLIADHQFPGPVGPIHPRNVAAALIDGDSRPADVVDELVTATIAAVEGCPCSPIVAHPFSVLPKVGLSEDDVTDQHLEALAHACLRVGASFEVNEKWRCPGQGVVATMIGLGVPISTGSDAHHRDEVGRHGYAAELGARLTAP